MMIDTHGYKMVGLKEASEETEDYGFFSPEYREIFYDRSTGEVWTVYQNSLGHNSWTEYHDTNIIKICNASDHYTAQEIADMIDDAIAQAAADAAREAEGEEIAKNSEKMRDIDRWQRKIEADAKAYAEKERASVC